MSERIRRAYAINQWKPNFDDFTRRDQHLRAFKVIAACGFTGVELHAGTGRWDPLGRPASIAANYGSTKDFVRLLADVGIDAITSWYFDPGAPIEEELSHGRSILDAAQHPAIANTGRELADFLAEAHGDRLVVRALPSAWQVSGLSDDQIATAARGWNAVGAAVAEAGVKVSLHADALSAAADERILEALLDATDPDLVGLTVDTAELTIAGLDPVATYERHHRRVDHVQLKDARCRDDDGERLQPHAEQDLMQAGGVREVERWFYECGTAGGLVDFARLMERMRDHGYGGWVVFESDQSPNPSRSVMLNGWYARHVLAL
ncbi:MAG TPA: TIM barrel protein [Actinoplanes sp.]